MESVTVCNTFMMYSEVTYGCSQGNHMPDDLTCPWNNGGTIPDGEYAGGTLYYSTPVTVCSSIAIDNGGNQGGGGSGSGGRGGGGETSPYPPEDYNPCEPGLPCTELAGQSPAQLFANQIGLTDFNHIAFLGHPDNVQLLGTLKNYYTAYGNSEEVKEFLLWAVGYLYAAPNTWTAFNDVFFSGPKGLVFEDVIPESIATPLYMQSDYNMIGVAAYFTESEFENVINNLNNDFNDEPIQLYLIACYKNSKLLNSSLYSTSNSLKIGDYTVTPHYNAQGTLVFYSAWRSASLGIEYLIKASALNDFKNNHTFYRACANLFYVNGKPSNSQIQMGAGDYWKGLLTSYQEAFSNPYYYVYLAHAFIGTATNLKTVPNTNQPIKYTITTKKEFKIPKYPNRKYD